MEVREDDEEFKNPVDLMFDALEAEKPNHFAVRQYKKYKLAAGETGIQLSGVETGETKEMDTAGYVYTPLTLEFVCTDREQAAGFVEKINQEGAGMWIKSLQLEKDETAMKGTMEVVYCHDQ